MKKANRNKGFTLIELALVVLILAILASVAIPSYQDYVEKARLAELQLRVDAMRTAMAAAYETGVRSMFVSGGIGAERVEDINQLLPGVPISDDLTYPNLNLAIVITDKDYGKFGGEAAPYLLVSARNQEEHRTLRNFSEIMPDARWAWWVPSTMMVIPLLDPVTQVSSTPPVQNPQVQIPAVTQIPATQPPVTSTAATTTPTTTTQNPVVTTTAVQGNANPPFVNQNPTCVHPGNGHAFGRCRN